MYVNDGARVAIGEEITLKILDNRIPFRVDKNKMIPTLTGFVFVDLEDDMLYVFERTKRREKFQDCYECIKITSWEKVIKMILEMK